MSKFILTDEFIEERINDYNPVKINGVAYNAGDVLSELDPDHYSELMTSYKEYYASLGYVVEAFNDGTA